MDTNSENQSSGNLPVDSQPETKVIPTDTQPMDSTPINFSPSTMTMKDPLSDQESSPSVMTAVIITALVVGGLVYTWQHSVVRNLQAQLNDKNTIAIDSGNIKKQAASLIQGAFDESSSATTVSSDNLNEIDSLKFNFQPEGNGTVNVLNNLSAFGDLNNDGMNDGAIIIEKQNGPYDLFDLAVVTGWGSQKYGAATTFLGDRIKVEGLEIKDGVIKASILSHATNDYLDKPTLAQTVSFKLTSRGLEQI